MNLNDFYVENLQVLKLDYFTLTDLITLFVGLNEFIKTNKSAAFIRSQSMLHIANLRDICSFRSVSLSNSFHGISA